MATLKRRRGLDFWPGFVDALAALLMVMIFVILIFTIGQFVLSDAVSGRDRAISRLNADLAEIARQLSLATDAKTQAEAQLAELSASLAQSQDKAHQLAVDLSTSEDARQAAEEESARLINDIAALKRLKAELEVEAARLSVALDNSETGLSAEKEVSARSIAQVELLNRQLAAVRTQLEELNNALEAAKAAAQEKDLKIEALGQELNLALAQKARELARYRSEFFGRLREVLGNRKDIQIVGDRFVFASEVLFDSASADVSDAGKAQLGQLAATLNTLARDIPGDLPWILQVDGHTDRRPINTERFPSNWELSTARALAIVKFLRDQGIPARRLAATGYGEYQPIDPGNSAEAYAKNRRIELKLTTP